MSTIQDTQVTQKTLEDFPVIATRVVRHGLFWYYQPTESVINGEVKTLLTQHISYAGDVIDLVLRSDVERGEQYGGIWDQEESDRRIKKQQVRLPEPDPDATVAGTADSVGEDDGDGEEVELKDLDDQELVDWLMSTGEFDGNKKPTASEVVEAVGKDDKELAERVMTAENTATGGNPRASVITPLTAVKNKPEDPPPGEDEGDGNGGTPA